MTLVQLFEALTEFGWTNVFVVLLLIILFTNLIAEGWKKFLNTIGLESKKERIEKERDEKIELLEKQILELQASAQKFNSDRIHDREQSFEKQNFLTDLIDKVTETQQEIIKKVDNLAEQNRKYELADIRETLLQAYRYYTSPATNPSLKWTSMEAHTFMEQYQNYIDRNGNSHMQEVVYPAMRKLIEIPMHEYDAISELMESRHKQRH